MAGIYVHIPFCKQQCSYCNFHFSTSLAQKEPLLAALKREMVLRKEELQGQEVTTIYLGGGTPSLLSAEELLRMFDALFSHYAIGALKEVTLEANPDDLSAAYLKSLRATPVNRLSIGVQSFRDQDLRYMNRAHNAMQSEYAIKAAQDAGFENLSIDLIYGTPGLSDTDWQTNLAQVTALQLPHLSSYALTVEEKTRLHHEIKTGKSLPVLPEQAAGQFEILHQWAADNGFLHYEISNLAKPGHEAVHNTSYWQGVPYLGFGPSAHSFSGKTRSWNIANNARYIRALEQQERPATIEVLSDADRLNEYIMTSLRTMWGLDLGKIELDFGSAEKVRLLRDARPFMEKQRLVEKDNHLVLTEAGMLFADAIAAELFVA